MPEKLPKVEVVNKDPIPVKMVDEEGLPPLIVEDRRETLVPRPANTQYLIAVLFMMLLGVIAIVVLVSLRPDNKDNLLVIGLILGFLGPTTLSLLAFMKSQETHLSVNSRLDQFISNAKLAARAQGITEGRNAGRIAADARTDSLAAIHKQ